ncbi:peptidoglycan recognition protein family protein [Paenibacillus spongiae]|uniref:N-acetylmuramoyl-L-alanine amidase n=1 Tax=Paenibacillus spongiae TaxID=2909671 RepID=A0ABY5S750_9BACL|nr:N-acetylmuramoyl-L-alanine amidase [Paenibacillus spongiae]UVI28153.1 N-acetylmuramoyl-L-alanine amidase [Paenibacillus spongiae]
MIYTVDHIPHGTPCRRRQGVKINPTTITIHNTGNPTSTARNERGWLTNPGNPREASYHIVVDEREAIECIPLDEKTLHAGTAAGNGSSIGIEICESGDYAKALDNAAQLVADMLKQRGWGVNQMRRHFDWSGKICPRRMYDGGRWTGWTAFVNLVGYKMRQLPKKGEEMLEISKYQRDTLVQSLQSLHDRKTFNDPSWIEKAKDGTLTLSELTWLNTILLANK